MAGHLKTPPGLKALLRAHPGAQALYETLVMLESKSESQVADIDDRARVIFASALLEQSLRTAIYSHLPELKPTDADEIFEGESGPLSTFSARIKMAHALGVFGPKSKKDLERIKAIRNTFAHSRVVVHFSTAAVAEECIKFNALEMIRWGSVEGRKPRNTEQRFFRVLRHYFLYLAGAKDNDPLRYRFTGYSDMYS